MTKLNLKEPSTMAGFGLLGLALPQLVSGISKILDFDEGAEVGNVLGTAVTNLATGDWLGSLFIALMGGLAIWKKESK